MSLGLRRSIVAVSVTLLALSACGGGGPASPTEGSTPAPKPAEPARLTPEWTHPSGQKSLRWVAPTADGYLLFGEGITALRSDGSLRWSQQLADRCTTSAPNDAGDVAVSHGRKCRSVSVLDGATGKVRWTTRVPLVSKRYDSGNMQVSLGNRAVTLVQFCGQVTRLAVKDGRQLGILAPHDRKCANEADSDGRTLAIWHDPEDASTPDDHGTGWIPQTPGNGTFALYDADSGKLLWRREANRQGSDLSAGAVVSSDPLVLALKEKGHTTLRLYDRKDPAPGAHLGRQLAAFGGPGFEVLGVADGVLVGSAVSGLQATPGVGPRLYAFDLTTGEQLWSRDVNPYGGSTLSTTVAGVDTDGVVVATAEGGGGDDTDRTWLVRWDLRTGEESGVIGVLPGRSSALTLEKGTVLVAQKDSIARVPLRAADFEVTAPRTDLPWADGDVRDVTPDCLAISDGTLHLLGLDASRKLPVPLDCHWSENSEPDYSSRDLWVDVIVGEPGVAAGDREAQTAVEGAKEIIRKRVSEPSGRSGTLVELELGKAEPVAGLGDEAYVVSAARMTGSVHSSTAGQLVVRVQNVVVVVEYAGGYDVPYRRAAPAPLAQVEDGLLQAARETLASYDLELGADPERPADGGHTKVPDVCALLDDDARSDGLTERTAVSPKGHLPRSSSCTWSETGDRADDLTVHAWAVEGSRFQGGDAVATAEAVHAASADPDARKLKDLGDRADLLRQDSKEKNDGYDNSRRELWVRDGNLLVNIDYSRWGTGLGASIEAEVLRLARKVLRASRG